jgi:hypothetical protein
MVKCDFCKSEIIIEGNLAHYVNCHIVVARKFTQLHIFEEDFYKTINLPNSSDDPIFHTMELTNCCDYNKSVPKAKKTYIFDRPGVKLCPDCYLLLDEKIRDRLSDKIGYSMSGEESLNLLNDND